MLAILAAVGADAETILADDAFSTALAVTSLLFVVNGGSMAAATERLAGLDALRGMAAVSIAIYHTVVLRKLVPADELPGWFSHLYLAVPLFFAISAFSLSAGYFGRLRDVSSIGRFCMRRFLRIAPLYYVMILAWVLTYSYLWGQWRLPAMGDVVLNVLFLFNFYPESAASLVPAGWSLGVEMIFYLAFPLLILLLRDVRSAAIGFLIACTGAAYACIQFQDMPNNFGWFSAASQAPFFVGGVLLFHIYKRLGQQPSEICTRISLMLLVLSPALLVAFSLAGGSAELYGWNAKAHIFALALLPLLLSFALMPFPILVNRSTIFLGKVSYGIYLLHPLVIVVIARPLHDAVIGTVPPWLILIMVTATTLFVSVPLAALTYFCFERPVSRWNYRSRVAAQPLPAT